MSNTTKLMMEMVNGGQWADAAPLVENVGQTIWTQLKQMKLNGFPLLRYLGAKNSSASKDGLTVDLRGKWKGRVIIKLNKATDLYDLTFGRVRKYEWIVDSKVLGVEVGNLAHVLQRYVEYGEAKKKKTKKGKTITAGVAAALSLDEDDAKLRKLEREAATGDPIVVALLGKPAAISSKLVGQLRTSQET